MVRTALRKFNALAEVRILLPRPRRAACSKGECRTMSARIYKPAKTAMQSGRAKTKDWVLDYEPEEPRVVEPLMGWTSSGDTKQQLRLTFDTPDEAIAYCERHGIPYQVFEEKLVVRRPMAYAENFSFRRRDPWTH
jgi:hypothetical protein